MKHQTVEELQQVARVRTERVAMSRAERLERWAELLERDPGRDLGTLPGTEYEPAPLRGRMRGVNSPITVAFEDAVLRAEGMADDTYGEAKRFFDLSDWELHEIVCYCHFGATMSAGLAARRVRAAMTAGTRRFSLARIRNFIAGRVGA